MPNAWRIFPNLGKTSLAAGWRMKRRNGGNPPFFAVGTHPAETVASPSKRAAQTPRFRERTMTMTYRNTIISAAFALLATATLMASTAALMVGTAGVVIA
jgi:hypothetical protein